MEPLKSKHRSSWKAAFTLVEMVVTISVISILLVTGVSLLGDSGSKSRRAATDTLTGLIEQGRSTAITSHSRVLLAFAEPKDLPAGDNSCRVGLFKLTEFNSRTGEAKGELLRRWDVINTGVALIGGNADGFRNVMDEREVKLSYVSGKKEFDILVHGIVFNPRGGREWPLGSTPVVLRIAEGGYRGPEKQASANKRGEGGKVSEDRLKIGRVIARPHRFDP